MDARSVAAILDLALFVPDGDVEPADVQAAESAVRRAVVGAAHFLSQS